MPCFRALSKVLLIAAALMASACASAPQPAAVTAPPTVILADPGDTLYRSVTVHVSPDRRGFQRRVKNSLADAQMLAPQGDEARYLLAVDAPRQGDGFAPTLRLMDRSTGATILQTPIAGATGSAKDALRASFVAFLEASAQANLVKPRLAATCRALNPSTSVRSVIISTPTHVGVDCPRPPV